MTPQELDSLAIAINEAIADACTALRQEHAQALEDVRRNATAQVEVARSLEQRCERAEARADQLQRDLDATREQAALSPITAAMMDAAGVLHVVMRSGERLEVRVADFDALVAARVSDALGQAELRFVARMDSQFAGALQRLGDAPRWSKTAVYRAGSVVSAYSGRTYVVRDGVAASVAHEPGDHPDVWERIGSHGIRVLKSRPEHLEPGDVFTEGESRFIFDGETTTLLVPRALKQSDLDRVVNSVKSLAQSAMDHSRATRSDLEGLQSVVRSVGNAANDAGQASTENAAWIASEGAEAARRAQEAQTLVEALVPVIESPALQDIIGRVDAIEIALSQHAKRARK
jgi:hypothetical protein